MSVHFSGARSGTPLRGARVLNVTRALKAKRSPSEALIKILAGIFPDLAKPIIHSFCCVEVLCSGRKFSILVVVVGDGRWQ